MSGESQKSLPTEQRPPLQLWGYPISLWIVATAGLIALTSLLALFLWELAQEPLHFELPPEAPPARESRIP